jgi:hypothetical protein
VRGVEAVEEFQDEVKKTCQYCGKTRIVGYWDYELEAYIYLSKSNLCLTCETLMVEKESA